MDDDFRGRIRSGDEGTFAVLFRRHATAVYNHCFRLSGDWTAAEDCTSLTFLEAWRLRGKVDPHGDSLLPWLLGISTNVMRQRRRTAWRHHRLMEKVPPPELVPDLADEVVERLEDQERIAAVKQVLDRLSRADRDMLALCVWSGLGYAAAAEALGVPVGTVRSRLSRARRRLEKAAERNLAGKVELGPIGRQIPGDRTDAVRPQERRSR